MQKFSRVDTSINRREIAGSKGLCIFSFSLAAVFCNCKSLHSHQQSMSLLIAPHICQHLELLDFVLSSLVDVKRYIIVQGNLHFFDYWWGWVSFHIFVGCPPHFLLGCFFKRLFTRFLYVIASNFFVGFMCFKYIASVCSLVAQTVKSPPTTQKTWLWSLGWEDPLEKGMATHSSILAWKIQRVIAHGVAKSWTRLSN